MLSNKIVGSDDYYSLSFCAQSLYVQLNMVADDDGVVQSPKKVFSVMCREVDPDNPEIAIQRMKQIKDAFDELAQKRFVLTFPSGVVVIKHWCMNNSIRKDRYKASQHQEELSTLTIKDNGAYTEKDGCHLVDSWLSAGCHLVVADKNRLDKDSIGEDSVGKDRLGVQGEGKPTPSHPETKNVDKSVENLMVGIHGNVQLSQKELAKLKLAHPDNWERMVDDLSAFIHSSGKHYDRHYDIITGWAGGNV
jgi:hypothetical protein